MIPDTSKIERLKIAYDEELQWRESKNRILENILKYKISEKTAKLESHLQYMGKTETAMLNILEDVKELESNLKKERDRGAAIISSMGEGLIVIDRNYRIVLLNKIAEKLLEISSEKAVGHDAREIIKMYQGDEILPDSERPVEKMFKIGKTVAVGLIDNLYYKIPSGRKFPVILITAPLLDDEIIGAVVVFEDVTEEKALDEMRNSFISIASHQLRTPLTSIRWYSEMLIGGDAGRLSKAQKEFTEQIYSSVLKLNETINLLLSITRLESGKTELKPIKTDLIVFIKSIVKELDLLIKQKKLKVKAIFEKNFPKKIDIDASSLRQVILNLLSNSISYTKEGGKIEINLSKDGNNIICSVKDDGIGIPKDQQDKIFSKFFRANNAMMQVPNGTGLGLSLIKALVERWGGKVGFESPTSWIGKGGKEEKKGTIFYFTIPT